MKIPQEEKKQEAIERMKKIGIFPETIRQFESGGLVSESVPPAGACYWINDREKRHVEDLERDKDILVYHLIHSYTNIGEMISYMYVCDEKEEWSLDKEDISDPKDLHAFCYIENVSDPDLSEYGAIGFEIGAAGGLLRTW